MGSVTTVVEGEGIVREARLVVVHRPALNISPSGIIYGRLRVVAPPLPFVIVSGGWPSALIALLALNLPVQSAYFPARLHKYIKSSKCEVLLWKIPSTFSYDNVSGEVIFVVSGTSAFICRVLSLLPSEGVQRTITSVEFPLRGTSRGVVKSLRFQGRAVLVDFGTSGARGFWLAAHRFLG